MICSICNKRLDKHSVGEAAHCSQKYNLLQIERLANNECISCGDIADYIDPWQQGWCNGCLMFYTPPV